MLREAKLSARERALLEKNLRISKRKPSLKNVPARDRAQPPPYAILPLLRYLPKYWIVWESSANRNGFLGEAIRTLNGNVVMESGLELDGTDFLKHSRSTAHVQVTNPPPSKTSEWLERSYDNRQPFALLLPLDTWMDAYAQSLFQRKGISVIVLSRPIRYIGQGTSRPSYSVAWFTWGLPYLRESVTYGHIPLEKNLPQWMTRPAHKKEIIQGARSMNDTLAIKRATNPTWPKPTKGG